MHDLTGPEPIETTMGELIEALYEEFLAAYGDPELAAVATSALVQDRFADGAWQGGDPITVAA